MTERSRLTPRAKGTHAPPRRFAWAQVVVAGAFLLLVGRLYQLQVIDGEHYMRKSADNFVKELELPATRGQIRDRKGRVLVDNRPAYNVYITPRFFNTDAFTKLRKYLSLSDDQATALEVKVTAKRGLRPLPPVRRVRGHHARSTGIVGIGEERIAGHRRAGGGAPQLSATARWPRTCSAT